jgi:hypothetical protein
MIRDSMSPFVNCLVRTLYLPAPAGWLEPIAPAERNSNRPAATLELIRALRRVAVMLRSITTGASTPWWARSASLASIHISFRCSLLPEALLQRQPQPTVTLFAALPAIAETIA